MLESLDINGRVYLAVDRAAFEVGYQPSYIERLARGKWINASFVHGQCFVDLASLEAFIAASAADTVQQLHDEAVRERMDAAWLSYERRTRALPAPQTTFVVFGQVGVIAICGLLLSILTFSAVQAEVTWDDVTAGVSQSASVLRERVVTPSSVILSKLMFSREDFHSDTPPTSIEAFSPEVRIRVESDGKHKMHVVD